MDDLKFDSVSVEKFAHKIRWHIINTIIKNGEGHAGPSLSCADIVATLYGAVMRYDPKNPGDDDRDRFIMSAGHKCLALYGGLIEAGIVDAEVLKTYNHLGTPVPAHPDMKKLSGVEFSTGSLGHGLSIGSGISLAAKLKNKSFRTFVLMGDGEQGEGSVWEAAAYASAKKLDNLIAIIDRNGLQINGTTQKILDTSPLEERWKSFGWHVAIADGHDPASLFEAFAGAPYHPGTPTLVICNTIKSKGMPFAEGDVHYHYWDPSPEEGELAIKALKEYEKRWA